MNKFRVGDKVRHLSGFETTVAQVGDVISLTSPFATEMKHPDKWKVISVALYQGDKFRIDDSAYRKKTFRVMEVQKDASEKEFSFKCQDENDNTQFFSQTNLDFYGDKVKIVK